MPERLAEGFDLRRSKLSVYLNIAQEFSNNRAPPQPRRRGAFLITKRRNVEMSGLR